MTTLKSANNWVIYYYYLFIFKLGSRNRKRPPKRQHKTRKILVKVTFKNGKGYQNKSNVGKKNSKKERANFCLASF